ncbi:pyridoxal phosphate-dependent aminotransferase family protein [Candidatus Falkowbacteria bacterium]|jgi:8-amino-7-oxononanoate synthase|nr:pyridoxal phosphate-dependent aminotransferase family protein [Candidatus Falkowbacteria bacterium]MBT4433192.1 pyridoxal phosphate-dependent aminotransferase family protein [Candidatus Falkowbacteria bacterium]
MQKIKEVLQFIKKEELYPDMPVVNSPHKPEVVVNGKKVIIFASNNYLGMTTDKRVIEAAKKGAEKWGIGNGSARLLTGNLDIHLKLEKEIASFKNKEAALTFVSGYMVNEGCIPAIAKVIDISVLTNVLKILNFKKRKTDTVVFSDEYNHASAIVGIRLSGARKEIYKHNDMEDLEKRLKKYPKKTRKMIVTDGVFSMDGDIVKLPELIDLAKKYDALVYLDDAHAAGILGKNGRGTEEYFGIEGSVDFVMGTFTKAFGGVGGYITGSQELIDYLKIAARSFIFTAPIAPPVVCGLIESIKIVKEEENRRKKLLENSKYFREKLHELGFSTMASETQIIPVLIGEEKRAVKLSRYLLDRGIFVPVARWPAVPKGMARLRFALMSSHTTQQIDFLLGIMKDIKNKTI